jgi:hypothetical protein
MGRDALDAISLQLLHRALQGNIQEEFREYLGNNQGAFREHSVSIQTFRSRQDLTEDQARPNQGLTVPYYSKE